MNQKQLGIRNFNIKTIINLISQNGIITRSQLSQLTKLTKGTVTNIVESLISRGVVEEIGEGKASSKGGRKPVFLQLVNKSFVSIGVDIRRGKISTVLIGLNGEILDSKAIFLSPNQDLDETSEMLIRLIDETIRDISSDSTIVGIGVGIIGPLDWKEGAVLDVQDFGDFKNISVKKLLTDNFHLPVYIESGANMAAYGESFWDKTKGSVNNSNLIYLELSFGLGYGMINNGQIIHGISSAGELGHMVIDCNGPECFCGRKGCLYMFSSGHAILEKLGYLNADDDNHEKQFGALLEDVVDRYYDNDESVVAIIREAVYYYMVNLENLGNLLSPHTITLGSSLKKFSRMFYDCMKDSYKLNQYFEDDLFNRIILPHYEEKAIAAGAAVFVSNHFFNNPAGYLFS